MVNMAKKDEFDDWDDMFDEFFKDFGIDIKSLNNRLMRIWNRILNDPNMSMSEPYVYGFTYRIGSDGKPIFQEFGNVPGITRGARPIERGVREPITDINDDDKKVYVTFELPGVSKDSIDLKISEYNITLNVDEDQRKYYKSIDFDYKLKPETATAKFNNGLLDVTVEKATSKEGSGRKVSIE
ncbi:small heat shock protein (hsp20) related protein [Thermoplasma acidophilum]|uniref:Small heat shock protein (Hsp20) related protein n=2 Tax=Thermoplasma acidophilum TaxID=2303 RepID=Q9HKX2_THEAC|nr:small heat shock protein (hsp20) related protein [Thermoplasma acidophilum]